MYVCVRVWFDTLLSCFLKKIWTTVLLKKWDVCKSSSFWARYRFCVCLCAFVCVNCQVFVKLFVCFDATTTTKNDKQRKSNKKAEAKCAFYCQRHESKEWERAKNTVMLRVLCLFVEIVCVFKISQSKANKSKMNRERMRARDSNKAFRHRVIEIKRISNRLCVCEWMNEWNSFFLRMWCCPK